jgi:adenine-specific DNA-methyltransferase
LADELKQLEEMTRDELIDLLRSHQAEGIRLSFSGREGARKLARKVQPRTSRRLAKYSHGPEEDQARNLVIEGENLQALVTLYRERGQVDLILTDPPYNTGNDFRYNDRWDEDPNDPNLGDLVGADEAGRHTKWMKFMLPRFDAGHVEADGRPRDLHRPSGTLPPWRNA